ncbi:glycoside hydrolase family 27 protein [Hydnum rufescens UP504]|uniref:Alpha-galactosidase n=1 Tax=Hydnum rufescens UP504 TaxID=1448309 RepID=A0A9P6E0S6_9AGAM|nr:glycoside hydrolase family 27 protein [Hydnum rufescens UP504]
MFIRGLTVVVLTAGFVSALDNGLARTPQMGWNTWNYFGCSISESTILGAARKIVSSDSRIMGINNHVALDVIMDDCWHASTRDPITGAPQADAVKFPNGIKSLADQVHALGLKIGIYSDAGTMTCGGRFGSLGYETIDAQTYASWGIDYLSMYKNMSDALLATGRPILYSMCNWGDDGPWNWATTIANSWRISGDIHDDFNRMDDRCPCDNMLDCKLPGYHCSVARIIDYASPLGQKAGTGKWNDLDMLEVGNGGMSYDEYVTHFSMWAILKSPLILGNDVEHMTEQTFSIITNDAIIAISQDSNGSPANRVWRRPLPGAESTYSTIAGTPSIQLWSGYLSGWATVVALLNTGNEAVTMDVLFSDVFVDQGVANQKASYRVYDLWQKSEADAHSTDGEGSTVWGLDIGVHQGSLKDVKVGPHQVNVWKFIPTSTYLNDATMDILREKSPRSM